MTGNLIACIVFLIIGIILFLTSIYQFILMKEDESRALVAIPLCLLGVMFIVLSCVHWNDDNEYKMIECTSYKIEEIVITENDSIIETKYKIYYK